MATKPAIPQPSGDPIRLFTALKENVEIITGRRGGKVEALSTSATTAQVIDKINEVIARLQA
jgi:hypothetical protein